MGFFDQPRSGFSLPGGQVKSYPQPWMERDDIHPMSSVAGSVIAPVFGGNGTTDGTSTGGGGVGPTGPTGSPGAPGVSGPTGPTGPPGVTSAVVDSVTSVTYGSPAVVSVSLAAQVLHFDFTIPSGPTGYGVTSAVVDSVTGVPFSTPPSVSVSLAAQVLHFDFSIPSGPTGPTGPMGPTGNTGPGGVAVADGVYSPVNSITVTGGQIVAIA